MSYDAVIEELKQTKYVLMQKMAQVDTALTVLVQLNNKPAENCEPKPKGDKSGDKSFEFGWTTDKPKSVLLSKTLDVPKPKTKLSAAGRAKIVAAQRARRVREAAAKAAKKGKK
jgi:hypothetical protein